MDMNVLANTLKIIILFALKKTFLIILYWAYLTLSAFLDIFDDKPSILNAGVELFSRAG